MSGYAEPVRKPGVIRALTSQDIDRLFRRAPGWFSHAVVRRRLYAKGFPHPVERNRWSAIAVGEWFAAAGRNLDGKRPPPGSGTPKKGRPRAGRGNAYATVSP